MKVFHTLDEAIDGAKGLPVLRIECGDEELFVVLPSDSVPVFDYLTTDADWPHGEPLPDELAA